MRQCCSHVAVALAQAFCEGKTLVIFLELQLTKKSNLSIGLSNDEFSILFLMINDQWNAFTDFLTAIDLYVINSV